MAGHNFKVVLLGEGCVGKTSTVLRYVENKFESKHLSTLQAAFMNKKVTVKGQQVHLSIWDTAGQERFHALGPIYYRDSHGAILVYDITDEDSFHKVQSWVKELKKMLGSDISLVIAGNKVDLEKNRNVDRAAAERYADSVFQTISEKMLEVAMRKPGTSNARRQVQIVDDREEPRAKSGCCGSN